MEKNTPAQAFEVFNMRTGKTYRTFESRKTAQQFARLYNDLARTNNFNTRIAKAGK